MHTFFYNFQILPGMYILTSAQTTETYQAMWAKIFELIPEIKRNVRLISIDYEKAAIAAVKSSFPPNNSIKISVCYFHHKQVNFFKTLRVRHFIRIFEHWSDLQQLFVAC